MSFDRKTLGTMTPYRNCHALCVLKPRGDGTIQDKETTDRYLKTKVDPARARCLDCISVEFSITLKQTFWFRKNHWKIVLYKDFTREIMLSGIRGAVINDLINGSQTISILSDIRNLCFFSPPSGGSF